MRSGKTWRVLLCIHLTRNMRSAVAGEDQNWFIPVGIGIIKVVPNNFVGVLLGYILGCDFANSVMCCTLNQSD